VCGCGRAAVCNRLCVYRCARANACIKSEVSGSPVAPGEALLAELRDFANLAIAKSIADIRYWRLKWNQFRIRCGISASSGYRLCAAARLTEISKIERGSPSLPRGVF